MKRESVSTLLRAIVVVLLAFLALEEPTEAFASESQNQCFVCTITGACPLDPHDYDSACRTWCGQWTYGGACWDDPVDPENPCGFGHARVICYEPS